MAAIQLAALGALRFCHAMAGIPIDAEALTRHVLANANRPLLVGLTGSVAVGKTWLANTIAKALPAAVRVATVSTDGFLHPNSVLESRGLVLRKGFPESYDVDAMLAALVALRHGTAAVPVHSHVTYDIDPTLTRQIGPADIIIIEGLGLSGFPDGRSARSGLDLLIYLDADPADIETWYVTRFLGLWRAGADDPTSFYNRFAHLAEAEVEMLARSTWDRINLPNLTGHIIHARETADILLHKTTDHRLLLIKA